MASPRPVPRLSAHLCLWSSLPPTGISPPSESSGADRSRSSPEEPKIPAVSRIPAASDTSMEWRGEPRQRAPTGPEPSSSNGYRQDIPTDLSASQASFLAGAAAL